MPSKRLQKHTAKKSRLSDSLNSQRWRFLQNGLDDFRHDFPPLCDHVLIQHTKRSDPGILPGIREDLSSAQQKAARMLRRKPQGSVSKLSPRMVARRGCVMEIKDSLTQHPFTLYPHLEESISPELFKDVVSILDPDMLQMSKEGDRETKHCILPAIQSPLEKKRSRQTKSRMTSWKAPGGKDPYTWFSKKEVAAREREAKLNYIPPLSENVKQATRELCSWLDSLGGEKHDIDEAAIISLFDASYETEPPGALSVHVVEWNDLPTELQMSAGISPPQVTTKWAAQQDRRSEKSCRTRWEKTRYGAWYLEPKTWKKMKANEPLEHPNSKDERIKNSRGLLGGKDAETMQLHGIHAFKEFLGKKGYHIPEFLNQMLAAEEPPARPKAGILKCCLNEFWRREELQEDNPLATENEHSNSSRLKGREACCSLA
ncbi:protein FAM47E [Pogona vitticeps]